MASQPSSVPTRKLATMLVGVDMLIGPVVAEWWPQAAPAAMAGEAFTALVSAIPPRGAGSPRPAPCPPTVERRAP